MSGSHAGIDAGPSVRERLEGRVARWLAHVPGALLLRVVGESPRVIDGATLDAHLQFLLAVRRIKGEPAMCEPTLAEGRLRYRHEVLTVTGAPTPVARVTACQVPGAAGPLDARHYAPESSPNAPLLVYLHGGGFAIGDLDTHDEPCRQLCRHAQMHVLSVAYRLAPEHPFPAGLDDALAALRWAMAQGESLGADPSAVCVGGDSAGGNLATVAALALAREGRPLLAQLLIYPVTDADVDTPSRARFATGYVLERRDVDTFRDLYLAGDLRLRDDPRASPRRERDVTHSPPALVVTGGFDPLRDEGRAWGERLQLSGTRVVHQHFPSLVHGFLHMTTVSPAAREAMLAIACGWRDLVAECRGGRPPGPATGRPVPPT